MNLIDYILSDIKITKDPPQRIIVCTHAKFSAIELCRALQSLGIEIFFFPVDYSKELKNLEKIASMGVKVIETQEHLLPLFKKIDAVIEDGARLSKLIAKYKIPVKNNFFAVEQTSGGVRFFSENPPKYPVVNVAMSQMKLDIENRRATPEGVIRYFAQTTGMLLGGKEVFIIGFGSIGEGVANLAQTLGAHVTIYDVSAAKRMLAKHHGYSVVEKEAFDHTLPKQDVIFMATNTYQGHALSAEQLLLMKNNAVICNAGSGRGELAMELQGSGVFKVHDANMEITEESGHIVVRFEKNHLKKTVTVLGKSFPINLHLGEGTSHDAIEIVMSLLLFAIMTGPQAKESGLQPLSNEIQERVASAFLLKDRQGRTFEPTYVQTRSLVINERPYGGVFPFHNELSDVANLSIVRAWFKVGSKTRGHYHRRSQEAYYAEKGEAAIITWPVNSPSNKKTFLMSPGDYLIVPENHFHDVNVALKEDFECLVIATPPFSIWDQFFNKTEKVG